MRDDQLRRLARGARAAALHAVMLATLGACGGAATRLPQPTDQRDVAAPSGQVAPVACTRPVSAASAAARCLTVRVPEDRRRPDGPGVRLHVVVVPPVTRDSALEPIFYFSGGPGQAATDGVAGTLSALAGTRARRAIVLVDQRGTGASRPLHCELGDTERTLVGWLTGAFDRDALRACRERLVADGADLARYATADAVEDVEAVRRALGYGRINLFGISYGTRVAVEYARRYPEHARTATLRGLHAPDSRFPLEIARDAQRALDLTLAACERERRCREAFPAVRDDVTVAFARARTRPVRLALGTSAAGGADSITVTPDVLAGTLLFALYGAQGAAAIPGAARAAARGDFTPWTTPGLLFALGASRTMALGMYLSVVCTDDVPRIDPREVAAASRESFLGDVLVANLRDACGLWLPGVQAPGAPPVRSAVPTLVLAGDIDPVTPPRWGEALLRGMSRGRQVVLAATGHVPSMPPCAADLLARFVDAGAAEGLDASCAARSERPPFTTEAPSAGPAQRATGGTDVSGTWDLYWTRAAGASPKGFLVIHQADTALVAEVHGEGSLEARGSVRGDSVVLTGRRIAPFEIRALVRGDTLTGMLKVLTVERHFTGVRRR